MPRALPWILSAVLFVAFAASFSELQRVRTRFGEVSRHTFHDHAEVRQFMISAAIEEADQPIVVIGDSVTEMAPLPRDLCGHPVINAGIGGLTIAEYTRLLPRLFADRRPFLIVSAVGANDTRSGQTREDYELLLKAALRLTSRVVSISPTSDAATRSAIERAGTTAEVPFFTPDIPASALMSDGLHFTAAAYRIWLPALENVVTKECR